MGDHIKKMLLIALLLIDCTSGFCNEEILYPPKQPETTTEEMVAAGKGLINETIELGVAIVEAVEVDGGVVATLKKHKKFYGSIGLFCILFFVWSRNRDR